MGAINGRVVVKETGAGVPGLVVTAYAASAEEERGRVVGRNRRLGSTVTEDNGRFGFEFELPATVRQDWDMVVTVGAPDDGDPNTDETNPPLASLRRSNPAPRESFHIRIATARLVEAEVIAAPAEPDPHGIVERARAARQFQAVLQAEDRQLLAGRIAAAEEIRRATEVHFGRFLNALSDADGGRPGSRYVPPGASIRDASLSALRDGITGSVNRMSRDTVGVFTAEQLASLRQQHGQDLSRVPARAVEDLLWPGRPARPSTMIRLDPTWWCRRQIPINDCVKILDPDSAEHEHDEPPQEPSSGGGGNGQQPESPPAPATVPDLIARMTATMTSPEEKVLFGLRPSVGDIQGDVDGFSLRSGPADVPATHDFHRLEIAFESIWQELFDQGAIDTGQQLYEEFVELGLDPNKYLIGPDEKVILNVKFKPSNPGAKDEEPFKEVTEAFEITQREWLALDADHRKHLKDLADKLKSGNPESLYEKLFHDLQQFGQFALFGFVIEQMRRLYQDEISREANEIRAKAARIIKYAKEKLQAPRDFDQFHTLLQQLGKQLKEPYRFNVYAAGRRERSVNFGVVVTYRQKWTPVTYQVGELVRTVPLAPKEVRKYTRKVVRKLSRAEKEARSSLESLRTETSVTARVEGEIIAKAMNKTNFQVGAEAGINLGIANVEGSTKLSQDVEQSSQETKKEFRESVFKAAAEYKSEHKVEVDVSQSAEFSDEESGEISNPNDELPVTYLFYELQRRYRVEETLKKVTPVILVAQEFPRPHEIDEDWIVAHDWILRRVILDDSFIPAMNYLSSKVVGDEHALNVMFENLQQQRRILDKLTDELVVLRSQVNARYDALQRSIKRRADAIEAENNEGFFEEGISGLFGGDSPDPEAMKAREDAARDAYQRLVGQERDLTGRLERETTAVAELTDKYTKQLSDHLNRRTQISRLRVHIKANIFHYMQAIYSYEHPDARLFRLRDVQVPRLTGAKTYSIVNDPDAIPLPPMWTKPHKLKAHVQIDPDNLEFDSLGDIADLDNLLGFKGNYMMFPLKQENALTDFMMTPYYDPFTGMRDPDQLANWTLHEFAEYVCCLRKHTTAERFDRYLPGLIETYRRLKERHNDDDELVVPTGSLYIEALPGAHPILEDFKLAHRAIDVKKVQAEVRGVEMENLRMAARLLAGEREDPTIEKKIVIEGDAETVVLPDET